MEIEQGVEATAVVSPRGEAPTRPGEKRRPRTARRILSLPYGVLPPMTHDSTLRDLPDPVRRSWRTFLERCEALRPELYRYCRYLARSPWEAEDLVQETLARAFVALAQTHQEIDDPRAWLFRVASNLWLNQVRDRREVPASTSRSTESDAATTDDPRATREAAGTLIGALAPKERAAVVLKDVFDLGLDEIAATLSVSVGAVKAALHRGRGKLEIHETAATAVAVPAVLDAFVRAFNARDLDAITSLLLDTALVEHPGLSVEYGAAVAKKGSLAGALFGKPDQAIAPAYRTGLLADAPRIELRVHRGEPLLLGYFAHEDGEAVRVISRAVVEDGLIVRLRTSMHAPEVIAEICAELGVPFRSSGYRYWW